MSWIDIGSVEDVPLRGARKHFGWYLEGRPGGAELRARLVQRWLDQGLAPAEAEARADGNDLRNARLITERALPADILFRQKDLEA